MRRTRALAAAQTVPLRGDVDGNIRQHARLVRAAADERVQILVFPELSLTGYELDLARDLALSESDPRLGPLLGLAFTFDMTLVVGAPVRIASRLHIGAFILFPDRTIGLYTKHHLGAFPATASPDGKVPAAEKTVFCPGDRNPLVPLGGGNAAVAVCADAGHPSHPREAAARGATTYLASMFVIPTDLEEEKTRLKGYALQHSITVVFANYGGPTGRLPSGGGSAIWNAKGELVAQLGRVGNGLAMAFETEAGWHGKALILE